MRKLFWQIFRFLANAVIQLDSLKYLDLWKYQADYTNRVNMKGNKVENIEIKEYEDKDIIKSNEVE